MSLEIRDANRYGPLTEERLAKLERKLKCRLPDDYRAFMLANNGGRPTLSCFTVGEDTDGSLVEWFFAIHDQPYEEPEDWDPESRELPPYFGQPLEGVLKDFRSEHSAKDLLPVARDPGGNLICLGISGKRAGGVWWYDHETETFAKLAESFTAFLAGLTKLPPDDDWHWWLIVE
jgi:cell wall assembly regulator SMI1